MPRSGTNYLWDLLCTHPACAPARLPVREDLFLEHSDHLADFVEAVRSAWNPSWGDFSDELINGLYAGLGEGLTSFLWIDRDRRLLTKSPSVSNVDRFFRFFPGGRLVILIRDGRSITQSCMSTFGWEFERGARTWASAAAEIRRFMANHSDSMGTYLLVRYEDLLDDLEGSMRRILDYLGLDPELFDFDRAAAVAGSRLIRVLRPWTSWRSLGPGREDVRIRPKAALAFVGARHAGAVRVDRRRAAAVLRIPDAVHADPCTLFGRETPSARLEVARQDRDPSLHVPLPRTAGDGYPWDPRTAGARESKAVMVLVGSGPGRSS